METNNKTIEADKPEVEEKKITSNVPEKVITSEDKKSDPVVTTKDDSDQKQNTKRESNDSEDIGFEIITPDVTEKQDVVQPKSNMPDTEVKEEPKPGEKNIKEENLKEKPLIKGSNEGDEKNQIKEAPIDASLIDIKVIKETNDETNKDSPESDAQNSEELELALKEMPGISSSVSKEILAKANDEEDKNIVDDIETKTEEREGGTLIDITVIEETNTDKKVQDVIEEAEHSFEAEVIEDNEEIKVIPSDDEDVIEYTLETRHILPFLTILVAFIAVFAGLIFYYN